jgi:hypothetical protein
MTFFDDASINGGATCGAGGSLKRLNNPDVRWIFNCGGGSNTKVELVGAWETSLWQISWIFITSMLGDSKVVIEWLQRKGKLHATKIEGWKRRVRDMEKKFQGTYFQHIFRESNEEADRLSKRALEAPKGNLIYFTWNSEIEGPPQSLNFKKKRERILHCWNSRLWFLILIRDFPLLLGSNFYSSGLVH